MSRYDDMPPEKLEELRRMIEEMDNTIEVIDDDTRELIEKRWPWLLCISSPRRALLKPSNSPLGSAHRACTVLRSTGRCLRTRLTCRLGTNLGQMDRQAD